MKAFSTWKYTDLAVVDAALCEEIETMPCEIEIGAFSQHKNWLIPDYRPWAVIQIKCDLDQKREHQIIEKIR